MLRNNRRSGSHFRASDRLETRASRFPMHRMRKGARRQRKWRDIARNIERLDPVLRIILAAGFSPAPEFHIQFAVMLVASPIVKGIDAQNRGRFQVRCITNDNDIGSVTETAIQLQLRARPLVTLFLDAEMKSATRVGPCIVSVVQVIHTPPRSLAMVRTPQS